LHKFENGQIACPKHNAHSPSVEVAEIWSIHWERVSCSSRHACSQAVRNSRILPLQRNMPSGFPRTREQSPWSKEDLQKQWSKLPERVRFIARIDICADAELSSYLSCSKIAEGVYFGWVQFILFEGNGAYINCL